MIANPARNFPPGHVWFAGRQLESETDHLLIGGSKEVSIPKQKDEGDGHSKAFIAVNERMILHHGTQEGTRLVYGRTIIRLPGQRQRRLKKWVVVNGCPEKETGWGGSVSWEEPNRQPMRYDLYVEPVGVPEPPTHLVLL